MFKEYTSRLSAALLTGLFITGITACSKDFLETKSEQSAEIKNAIKDLPTLRAAVTGVYSLLQSETYYGRTYSLLPDLMSDNEFISVVNSNRYRNQDQYITTANDAAAADTWNQLYAVVANCNLIIQKGPGITLNQVTSDTTEARQLVAEAHSLRAMAFFDLCRFYAQPYNFTANASHWGVPIVTTTDPDNPQSPARNTVQQSYAQIISDLSKASEGFGSKSTGAHAGRFNLHAARALLSRVMLYKGDWKGADSVASLVIRDGKYKLLERDKLVNDFKLANNGETILEVVNNATDNRGTASLAYFYDQLVGYGDAIASKELYDRYDSADVRKSFMRIGKRTGSGGENPAVLIMKYKDPQTENIKLIRLSEIFLIRAEALARLGNTTAAQADVTRIANRADTLVKAITATGDALISAILLEKRKELAFEGHRLFDLTRNKLSFTKYLGGDEKKDITYPADKTIQPIPQRELDANTAIRDQQNKGYF